jgi:hypothetical protein
MKKTSNIFYNRYNVLKINLYLDRYKLFSEKAKYKPNKNLSVEIIE